MNCRVRPAVLPSPRDPEPEQLVAAAVVRQALADLRCPPPGMWGPVFRKSAAQFFTHASPDLSFWCRALGVEVERVLKLVHE
jgi:hypothetical protein